jgi:hypothetical protein
MMGFDATQVEAELERGAASSVGFSPAQAEAEISVGNSGAAQKLLGPNFDSETFASPGLRLSLSRGDTLEEKRLRIKKKYPDGDIQVLPQSIVMGFDKDTIVWRETEQSQWKMIEPQGFQWADVAMDVAEAMAPSAESIVAETAMAVGSGGSTVPVTVGRQIMGAIAGELVEQTGQYVTGTQAQSILGAGGEAIEEGIYSGVGGFAMSPLAATYNIIRGSGALRVGDEGIEVIRAANELDKAGIGKKLTPGLVTDNPAMRLQEKQSSALLPSFQRRYREMLTSLDVAVRSSAPGNAADAMGDVVVSLRKFSDFFLGQIKRKGVSTGDAGKALQQGVKKYGEQSKIVVDDLYTAAEKIDDPVFDLEPFHILAGDLRAGAKGSFSKSLNEPLSRLASIKGPKELPSGRILSVTDQIRNIRTQLWDLKQVKPGELPTQATGQANDLYKSLTDVLNNPKNADPNFVKAWAAASDASGLRRKTLGQAAVMLVSKSETPFKLARSLVRPGEVDNLLAIRNTVPQKYWDEFVDAAYGEILKDPASARGVLDSFDTQTLDALFPKKDQQLLRTVTEELDRIYSVGVDEIAKTQVKNANFIDNLIRTTSPVDAYTIIRSANNINNRGMRDSFRAAIVDWAWDGVVEPAKGGLKANEATLRSHIKILKKSGLWGILSQEEKRIIGNAQIVSRAFQSVADAGTSIQAAEAAKGIGRLKAGAIASFIQAGIISRLYLSDMGRRMLIGGGLPNSNAAMLRLLGGSLAQISQPEDISALAREDEENK